MPVNDKNNDDPPFRIENNILKGKVSTFKSRYTNIGKLLFDRLKDNPNLVAQVDVVTGIEDTFGDILDMSIKCALWMQKQGVKSNDIISISSEIKREIFIPCIAALFVGATFNPLNHEDNTEMTRYYIRLIQPKVIFVSKTTAPTVLEAIKLENHPTEVVSFDGYPAMTRFADTLKGHSESSVINFQCTDIDDPRQSAIIAFTSGTTNVPKGIPLSHQTLLTHLELGKPPIDVWMWCSSLFWLSCPVYNMKNIIFNKKKINPPPFDEESICRIIEKYKVEWLLLNTTLVNRLVRYPKIRDYDLSTLKFLHIIGSPMEEKVQALVKKYLPNTIPIQHYSLSEMGCVIASQSVNSPTGSSGLIGPNCEVKIIDLKTGKTLETNQKGEICAKSITMISSYYKNPEITKKAIDEDGWIHTGDFGYFSEDGELFVLDRLSNLIKYKDQLIIPSEVEAVLLTHPSVLEAAVIAKPHPIDGEHPVAFVSKVRNKKVSKEELIDLVANELPDHYHLRGGVIFLSSLPYTSTGKISRKELTMIVTTAT